MTTYLKGTADEAHQLYLPTQRKHIYLSSTSCYSDQQEHYIHQIIRSFYS